MMKTLNLIREKLSDDPYIKGSVKARIREGRVLITGKVDAYWKKEIASEEPLMISA